MPNAFVSGAWLFVLSVLLLGTSCQKEKILKPGEVKSNVVTAVYISPQQFADMVTLNAFAIDGEAKQAEWGGPLDSGRPFTQIRCTADAGAGNPGVPIYVSMKAMYTDTDLYLLLEWADPQADEMKDAMYYVGPSLPDSVHGCQSFLTSDQSWIRSTRDEDRIYLAWELDRAGDRLGTFDQQGCRVACHTGQSPEFGRPEYGRLDVWEWLASRTNRIRNIYVQGDDPNFPKYGIPGYLQDMVIDPVSGLRPDPGVPTWYPNFEEGHTRPKYVYRESDDPFAHPFEPARCFNEFGEKCRINNGLPAFYIWREHVKEPISPFSECDTLDQAVVPQGQEAARWKTTYPPEHPLYNPNQRARFIVSGYYFSYPSGSIADVRGRAVYSDGFWTLEVARPLKTTDETNDVSFTIASDGGTRIPPDDVVFTVGVANASQTDQWGSGPQVLRFGPVRESSENPKTGGRP